ncbi:MAG TPA: GTPase [Gemmataceae bacterium]|nr:GTPase [Gemmataceae bacterium]
MSVSETTTWIACLTPPGQAALATLGLYGPRAWETLRTLFRLRSGGELPATPEAGRFWLGQLGDDMADEVVVAVKQAEPLPWLEVHGHGGREVVLFLLDLFRDRGLQIGSWEDFLRKTSGDSLSAAAAIALTQAATVRTAGILLDQQQGALGRAFDVILAALDRGDTAMAHEGLTQLSRFAAVGQRLTQPWRVAVAGAPNVGKSSLVNALAGYQRSVVAATPGTTRDVVTMRIALDGWLIELADTAGLRKEAETLEEQGILRARAAAANADLCLWVLDASASPVWPDEDIGTILYVLNKIDLPAAWECRRRTLPVSARTGEGLAELCTAVVARLVPDPPRRGAAVPFTPRLSERIVEAQRVLDTGDSAETRRIVASLCG